MSNALVNIMKSNDLSSIKITKHPLQKVRNDNVKLYYLRGLCVTMLADEIISDDKKIIFLCY